MNPATTLKYFFFSLGAHALLLAPLYFAFRHNEEIPLNASSLFVEVREIKASTPTPTPSLEPVPLPLERADQSAAPSSPTPAPPASEIQTPTTGRNEMEIQPEYPLLSRKLGEEGEATFILNLEKDGTVMLARLEKSSGFERLDEAARDALMKAKFPAPEEGAQEKKFSVVFRLKEKNR